MNSFNRFLFALTLIAFESVPAALSETKQAGTDQNMLAPPLVALIDHSRGSNGRKMKSAQNPLQNSATDLVDKGTELFAKGLIDEAEIDFKQAIQLNEHDSDALFNLGALAESRANLTEAESFYRCALLASPNDKEIKAALVSVQSRNKSLPPPAFNSGDDNGLIRAGLERPVTDPPNPVYVPGAPVPGLLEVAPKSAKGAYLKIIFSPNLGRATLLSDWLLQLHPDFAKIMSKEPTGLFQLNPPVREWFGHLPNEISEGNLLCGIESTKITSVKSLLDPSVCKVLVLRDTIDDWNADSLLRDYVTRGGYLIIDHTSLDQVPEIFPGTIELSDNWKLVGAKHRKSLKNGWDGEMGYDNIIDAHLDKPDPVLACGLVTNAIWHLPPLCPVICVIDSQNVRVLCTSDILAKSAPETRGALAVVFSWGRGYVFCFSGILENTKERIYNFNDLFNARQGLPAVDRAHELKISLRQGLLANFIYAGLTGKRIPELKQ
jgi:tetratricopeptide (TPR) repeat protein